MTRESIRIVCYVLAEDTIKKLSGIRTPHLEMATKYADFCEDDSTKMEALQMAVAGANNRQSPFDIFDKAGDILAFAIKRPPPKPSVTTGYKKKKVTKKFSR